MIASLREIMAGDENRTRRTESDYGISLCAMPLREICQTTPYSQTRKCPGGKNLTGQTEFDQNKGRGGRVRARYQTVQILLCLGWTVSCAGRSAAESSPRVGFAAGRIRESGDWTRTEHVSGEDVTDSTIQAASDGDA